MGEYGLIASVSGARLPWRSTDALNVTSSGKAITVKKISQDEQWQINACLNCPYPECHNCFDAWKSAFANIRYDTHPKTKKRKKANARI